MKGGKGAERINLRKRGKKKGIFQKGRRKPGGRPGGKEGKVFSMEVKRSLTEGGKLLNRA